MAAIVLSTFYSNAIWSLVIPFMIQFSGELVPDPLTMDQSFSLLQSLYSGGLDVLTVYTIGSAVLWVGYWGTTSIFLTTLLPELWPFTYSQMLANGGGVEVWAGLPGIVHALYDPNFTWLEWTRHTSYETYMLITVIVKYNHTLWLYTAYSTFHSLVYWALYVCLIPIPTVVLPLLWATHIYMFGYVELNI